MSNGSVDGSSTTGSSGSSTTGSIGPNMRTNTATIYVDLYKNPLNPDLYSDINVEVDYQTSGAYENPISRVDKLLQVLGELSIPDNERKLRYTHVYKTNVPITPIPMTLQEILNRLDFSL